MCRAVWPHMVAQGYGRIVNITSGAFSGMALHVAYGATKGGVWSMTRGLSAEGLAHGVMVNAVSPFARTRMTEATQAEGSELLRLASAMEPQMVSPVVAYLAHEDCPVTGECFAAAGGGVRRVLMSQTPGFTDRALTIESLAEGWSQVMDPAGAGILAAGVKGSRTDEVKPYRPLSS